jgi:hypothetical protein
MIGDIESTVRPNDDRLFLIMLPEILKKIPLRSPLKFVSKLLGLNPNLLNSDRYLGGMKIGKLA